MTFILHSAPPSTCSQRVRFTLHAKGLPFEEKLYDLLAGDQLKPAYLALNPNGVVPTFTVMAAGELSPSLSRAVKTKTLAPI